MTQYILYIETRVYQSSSSPTDDTIKEIFISHGLTEGSKEWNYLVLCFRNQEEDLTTMFLENRTNLPDILSSPNIANNLLDHLSVVLKIAQHLEPLNPHQLYRNMVERICAAQTRGMNRIDNDSMLCHLNIPGTQLSVPVWRSLIGRVDGGSWDEYLHECLIYIFYRPEYEELQYHIAMTICCGYVLTPQDYQMLRLHEAKIDLEHGWVLSDEELDAIKPKLLADTPLQCLFRLGQELGFQYRRTIIEVCPLLPLPREIRDLVIDYLDWDLGSAVDRELDEYMKHNESRMDE